MLDGLDAGEVRLSAIESRALLLSPDLHSRERRRAIERLSGPARVADHFRLIAKTVSRVGAPAVEYDLPDAVSHFLEKTETVGEIGSAKKTAEPGDLVVSRMRSYLREMAVVPRRDSPQLFSSEFMVLRPTGGAVSAQTLMALLLSPPAQTVLARSQYGTGHPRFYNFALTEMPIPDSIVAVNGAATAVIKKAENRREQSARLHRDAESLLLRELGLADWRPGERLWTVKTLSETFGASGRLDAEYHSPKYDELFAALRKTGCAPLGELADIRKSVEPGSDAYRESGIPFLRVADFSKFGFSAPAKFLDPDEYGETMSALKPRKDSVLLTKDGTVGIACKMEEDMDAITSGAILHLTLKRGAGVSPDYLALALNSPPMRMQAGRDTGGIVIPHWRPEEVCRALVPVPPPEKQREPARLARESFRLRRESKRLLDAAVCAVECAAEKGEQAAMKILRERAGDSAVSLSGGNFV